jgi:hypothetical protein
MLILTILDLQYVPFPEMGHYELRLLHPPSNRSVESHTGRSAQNCLFAPVCADVLSSAGRIQCQVGKQNCPRKIKSLNVNAISESECIVQVSFHHDVLCVVW